MELQEIEVTIDANGKVHIHVRGVSGTACLDLTRELEAALGSQVESRSMTPEALEGQPDEQPLDGAQQPDSSEVLRRRKRPGQA